MLAAALLSPRPKLPLWARLQRLSAVGLPDLPARLLLPVQYLDPTEERLQQLCGRCWEGVRPEALSMHCALSAGPTG